MTPELSHPPDFLVVGAAKCGTTSLRNYLAQHPDLFLPEYGEPSFFAHYESAQTFSGPGDDEWDFVTDPNRYDQLFAPAQPAQITGEISPRYLFFEQAASTIASLAPAAKLIAILRHPVDRAYSHFLMNRSRGCEPEASFEAALRLSSQRWDKGWGWDWMYVEASSYAHQVQRFQSIFPADQLNVFIYEEWVADPDLFFADVFNFLGVESSFRPDTEQRARPATMPRSSSLASVLRKGNRVANAARAVLPARARAMARKAVESVNVTAPEQLPAATRAALYEQYFASDVDQLGQLLGRDLDVWGSTNVG